MAENKLLGRASLSILFKIRSSGCFFTAFSELAGLRTAGESLVSVLFPCRSAGITDACAMCLTYVVESI